MTQRRRAAALHALVSTDFDLLVIGGGIHGAFAAWDASLRGLRVALIDRGDFGGETSSNSMKIAHGGLRYLQQADFARARQSARERAILFGIAPGIVRPLPCVIATRGLATRSPAALRAAFLMNGIITRPYHTSANGALPANRLLRAEEYARLAGLFATPGATGGALWHDGLISSTERLLIATVRSAENAGAVTANYVEARDLIIERRHVVGAAVRERDGEALGVIRARVVLNAAGPWSTGLLPADVPPTPWVRSCNIVIRGEHAPAAAAVASPLGRLLFAVPWRGHTILGTTQTRHDGSPDDRSAVPDEIESLVRDVNAAVPELRLHAGDVTLVHAGLVPASSSRAATAHVPGSRARWIDHGDRGLPGLVTMVGVKWTTARLVAERAVDLCVHRLGRAPMPSSTHREPIIGAEGFIDQSRPHPIEDPRPALPTDAASLYGSRLDEVRGLIAVDRALMAPLSTECATLGAQVAQAVRFEYAQRLTDVVFRRTEMGSAGHPGSAAVAAAASIAAAELGWSAQRRQLEVDAVNSAYPRPAR